MFSHDNKLYYASTRGIAMQRNNLMCVYGTDTQLNTYHRTEALPQQTRYSLNYLMKEEKDESINPVIIKDFNYKLNLEFYPAHTTLDDINNYYQENVDLATREMQLNAMMQNGGALCIEHACTTLESVTINGEPRQKLLSYPHVYLKLNFVPGIALADMVLTSAAEFLDLTLAILTSLEKMHEQFIHTNLTAKNIFLQKDEQGYFSVKFTDFSISRFSGSQCHSDTNQEDKLPESMTENILYADANQDIYRIAKMLKKVLSGHRRLFFTNIEGDINRVFSQMSHQTPSWRIPLQRAIELLRAVNKHPEEEVKRRLALIRVRLIDPAEKFVSRITDWCYYTTLEYQMTHQFDYTLEPEALAILQANEYFARTLGKDIIVGRFFWVFDTSEKLLAVLKELQTGNVTLPILALKYLHHTRKDYLATIFNTEEKLSQLTNRLPPANLAQMLTYLLESFQALTELQDPLPDAIVNAKLSYVFIQLYCLEFKANYFMQHAWQAYKHVIHPEWNIDVVAAFQIVVGTSGFDAIKFIQTIPEKFVLTLLSVLGVDLLKPKITTMSKFHALYDRVKGHDRRDALKLFGEEYLLSLNQFAHVEIVPDLHHFMDDISKSFHRDIMLQILKKYCREVFVCCQKDWEPTLSFLDGFNNYPQADLYASILYCCNQIYGDLRATQPDSLKTLFGAYNRDAKVAASQHLQTQLLDNAISEKTFKFAGLMQGDLGKIAQRVKRLYFPVLTPATPSRLTFPLR